MGGVYEWGVRSGDRGVGCRVWGYVGGGFRVLRIWGAKEDPPPVKSRGFQTQFDASSDTKSHSKNVRHHVTRHIVLPSGSLTRSRVDAMMTRVLPISVNRHGKITTPQRD